MADKPYKRPESVLVLVYTSDGEVLLLRRRQPPDFWQSVTGSLEWEETDPRETAQRELTEEIGLTGAVDMVDCGITNRFAIKPEWRRRYAPDVQENIEYVYRVKLAARIPVTLNPSEHTEYEWLPREQAAAKVFSWTNRDAILRFVPSPRPD